MTKVHGNAKSTIVIKQGRLLMANAPGNAPKARVFKSRFNAEKFARNMVRMSSKLRFKDFEFITI
jgi:hypothetical protein